MTTTAPNERRVPYGMQVVTIGYTLHLSIPPVRLGNSGLKISKIVLGCMSYGSSQWQGWVLDEEEGIKHIKYA